MYMPADICIIAAIIGLAAFVQGYGGFGFGLISMTVFAFTTYQMERMSVAVSVSGMVVLVVLYMLAQAQARTRWFDVALVMAGVLPGQYAGYEFIESFGDRPVFKIALGMVLIVFGINGLYKAHLTPKLPRWSGVLAGVLGGFLGGAFVSGGPPIVVYLYSRTKDPRHMKGTVQAVFMMAMFYRLVLIWFGETGYTMPVLRLSTFCVPAAVLLLWGAHRLSQRSSVQTFRKAVYGLICLFGVTLLVRESADGLRKPLPASSRGEEADTVR